MQMACQQLQEGFVWCIAQDFFIYFGEGYKQFNINYLMKGKEKCFLISWYSIYIDSIYIVPENKWNKQVIKQTS